MEIKILLKCTSDRGNSRRNINITICTLRKVLLDKTNTVRSRCKNIQTITQGITEKLTFSVVNFGHLQYTVVDNRVNVREICYEGVEWIILT
jgi:hypothetical protein